MSRVINNHQINFEVENSFIIGEKDVADENTLAIESLEKLNKVSEDKLKEEKNALNQRKAQIQKLEKLKIKIKNETEELQKTARELSNKILEEANNDAKKLMDDANTKAGKLFEESKKNGYDEGYKKSTEELKNLLLEAKQDIENAHEYKEKLLNNLEGEIIDLILSSVNKIIKTKLDESDEVIVNMILETIDTLNSRDRLIIKISSEDFDTTSKLRNKILAVYPGIKDIEIKIMDGYTSGDMEIESESGVVNPSIKSQIKNLQKEFIRMSTQELE